MLLAIETSCDETAVAIFDEEAFQQQGYFKTAFLKADLISSQISLHQQYGGVVPELAAREHLKNLPILIQEALFQAGIKEDQITVVAVTRGPGLKGCLLVGYCYALGFAKAKGTKFVEVNHIEGHLQAIDLIGESPEFPYLALIVSGGHTQLVKVEGFREYQILAATRDDAAGEAFDKIASTLGLPYPGGSYLSKLAEEYQEVKEFYNNEFKFPVGLKQDLEGFSFSGLKTSVSQTVSKIKASLLIPNEFELYKSKIAAAAQAAIVKALVDKSLYYVNQFQPKAFVLTGGVASNKLLRNTFEDELKKIDVKFYVPPPKWCTDNAAMIAITGAKIIQKYPNQNTINGVIPRWSLEEIK